MARHHGGRARHDRATGGGVVITVTLVMPHRTADVALPAVPRHHDRVLLNGVSWTVIGVCWVAARGTVEVHLGSVGS
jgi:hypothetical protein